MNRIEVPFIIWDGRKVGVALHKMTDGLNEIQITLKKKDGSFLYPNPIIIDKQKAINTYGINIINKGELKGIWFPLRDESLWSTTREEN